MTRTHTHACFINCHFVFIRGRTERASPKSIPTSNGSPGSTQTTEWLWACPSLHCGRCGYHLNPALLSNTAPFGWAPHFPSVPSQPASPAPRQGRQRHSCSSLPAGSCPGDATQSNAGQAGKMLPNGFWAKYVPSFQRVFRADTAPALRGTWKPVALDAIGTGEPGEGRQERSQVLVTPGSCPILHPWAWDPHGNFA